MVVEETHFISCEDDLPRYFGVYNYACSVTALLLLLLQVQAVNGMRKEYPDIILDLDAKLYLVAFLLLFYLNFHQHLTGYIRIDLDSGGVLYILFLSVWLHNSFVGSSSSNHTNNLFIPGRVARIMACGLAMILIGVCIMDPNRQRLVCNVIHPPLALYTVITMGIRSYNYRNEKTCNGAWKQWYLAVISLIAVQISVEIEEDYICNTTVSSRLYHAVVIHGLIHCLFTSVFHCAIQIIAYEHRTFKTIKNPKSK